jgi:hypothetical protein
MASKTEISRDNLEKLVVSDTFKSMLREDIKILEDTDEP